MQGHFKLMRVCDEGRIPGGKRGIGAGRHHRIAENKIGPASAKFFQDAGIKFFRRADKSWKQRAVFS